MAVVPLQCPHCLAMTNLRVTGYSLSPVLEEKLLPPFVSLLCECPECHKRVGVLTRPTNQADSESTPNSISNGFGNLMKATRTIAENGLTLVESWPKALSPNIPEPLPDMTEEAFLQAVKNLPIEEASCMIHRRALESGLAKAYPYLQGNLARKIKKLVADKMLTDELGTWAIHVRRSPEGRAFAEVILRDVFTLPGQVKSRSKPNNLD